MIELKSSSTDISIKLNIIAYITVLKGQVTQHEKHVYTISVN